MRKILCAMAIAFTSAAFAQVAISPDTNATPGATLDVQAINSTTTPDGVLVPRVDETRALDMPEPELSTLVWIEGDLPTVTGTRVEDVDAAGFYYYNGTKWVKLGGTATPFPATKTVVEDSDNDLTDTLANFSQALVIRITGSNSSPVVLPDASLYPGRTIAINNETGGNATYASGTLGSITTTIRIGSSHLLWSDGTSWWALSSRNG